MHVRTWSHGTERFRLGGRCRDQQLLGAALEAQAAKMCRDWHCFSLHLLADERDTSKHMAAHLMACTWQVQPSIVELDNLFDIGTSRAQTSETRPGHVMCHTSPQCRGRWRKGGTGAGGQVNSA